jgi:hypothetical protein
MLKDVSLWRVIKRAMLDSLQLQFRVAILSFVGFKIIELN